MGSECYIIRCSVGRCEKCSHDSNQGCMKLGDIRESGDNKSQIILVESEKGLFHYCQSCSLKQNEPPWRTDGWETVFVGINNSLFDNMEYTFGVYKVGTYLSIFKLGEHNHSKHIVVPLVRTELESSLIEELSHSKVQFESRRYSLKENISQRLNQSRNDISMHIMKLIPEINETTRIRLSEIISHRRNVLGSLMPIILDDLVEEIYLDHPGALVYFDHQNYGRCVTNITFEENEVPRIVTLIRSESNLHLDRSNPSLKMDLQIQGASLRFSASMPPLSPDGLHLEIRRARNNPFSVSDLIENFTMTPEVAAVLLFAITCRFNITITGGPGTGKTTLLNALDMATPKWWRKIYIEDAIESRTQRDHHQVRFRVNPVDEQISKFNKSDEIIKCLHRSPDYLILGEIQTAEHSKALFQAVSAGLRTIQTCHSESAASLISRWKLGHGINNDSLALMDVVVTLEKPRPGESERRVSEISEIRREMVNGILEFCGLNTVYDNAIGVIGNWKKDGAFMTRARESGVESHIPALKNLIDVVHNNMCNLDFEMLGERMWFHGNPMAFNEHRL